MFMSIWNGLDSLISNLIWAANANLGVVTVLGAGIVFLVYKMGKKSDKLSVAKAVLQEIRYSQHKVANYRTHETYRLSERVLPTNNWNKNVSLFVNDLSETAIDRISDYYSNVEHLDVVIKAAVDSINKRVNEPPTPTPTDAATPDVRIATTSRDLPQTAVALIREISNGIPDLDNTPITSKLREIAESPWYKIF
jgi:hypothetical protein